MGRHRQPLPPRRHRQLERRSRRQGHASRSRRRSGRPATAASTTSSATPSSCTAASTTSRRSRRATPVRASAAASSTSKKRYAGACYLPRRLRTCSVSVDLDPLSCYYGIHGLGAPPRELAHVVLRRALPRFAELFARRAHPRHLLRRRRATPRPTSAGQKQLGAAGASDGHELGNHSHTHPYELARLDRERIEDEIVQAHTRHRCDRATAAGRLSRARLRPVASACSTCSWRTAIATTRRCFRRGRTTWPRRA